MESPYEVPHIEICGQSTTLTFVQCDVMYMNWTIVSLPNCYDKIRFGDNSTWSPSQCYLFEVNGTLHYGVEENPAPDSPEIRRIDIYWLINSLSNITEASVGIPSITIMLYDPRFSRWDPKAVNHMIPQEVAFSTEMTQGNYRSTSLRNYTSTLFFTPSKYRAIPPHDSGSLLGFEPSFVDIYTISSTQLDWPMHRQDNINLTRGTEQRQHTLLSAVALAGGAYGAITTLYTVMFGMVRHSPWGMVHQLPLTVVRAVDKVSDKRNKRQRLLSSDHHSRSSSPPPPPPQNNSSSDDDEVEMAIVESTPIPSLARKSSDGHPSPPPPLYHHQPPSSPDTTDPPYHGDRDRIQHLETRMLEMQEVLREYYINMDFLDQMRDVRRRRTRGVPWLHRSSASSGSPSITKRDNSSRDVLGGWLYEDDPRK
ncbi:predicted protein [Lichtheimia corymbifera JMRC:FSU:9682]|uniref:Uncharacterized protein n=1 Tax=Lichtheimia corymbifera JMRC:FSU:9682 TaxID=1263082 RepID=A0A068RY73_9FUNG|nr:predicted protein [Lichtheimia corymbifera JMRC:FSU:9682]